MAGVDVLVTWLVSIYCAVKICAYLVVLSAFLYHVTYVNRWGQRRLTVDGVYPPLTDPVWGSPFSVYATWTLPFWSWHTETYTSTSNLLSSHTCRSLTGRSGVAARSRVHGALILLIPEFYLSDQGFHGCQRSSTSVAGQGSFSVQGVRRSSWSLRTQSAVPTRPRSAGRRTPNVPSTRYTPWSIPWSLSFASDGVKTPRIPTEDLWCIYHLWYKCAIL